MAYRLSGLLAAAAILAVPSAYAADAVSVVEAPVVAPETGLGFGIVVGAMGMVSPVYEGSDEYQVFGFPYAYPRFYSDGDGQGFGFADRLTIRGADDVRFAVIQHNGFEIGPVAGYNFGRDDDDADLIEGIGDVDDGLVLGAFAGYSFQPFFVDIAYTSQVTGEDDAGYQVKFAAGVEQALTERIGLTTTLSTAYASEDYMDTYFSISPAQAASSVENLPAFEAADGFKNVGIDVALDYRFTERATFTASAGYSRLIGDAADSPVTASEDQFRGGIGLTYTFGRVQ
jgi:outer membrane protein